MDSLDKRCRLFSFLCKDVACYTERRRNEASSILLFNSMIDPSKYYETETEWRYSERYNYQPADVFLEIYNFLRAEYGLSKAYKDGSGAVLGFSTYWILQKKDELERAHQESRRSE